MHVTFEMMQSLIDKLIQPDRLAELHRVTCVANPSLKFEETATLVGNHVRAEKESMLVFMGWTVEQYDTEVNVRLRARGL